MIVTVDETRQEQVILVQTDRGFRAGDRNDPSIDGERGRTNGAIHERPFRMYGNTGFHKPSLNSGTVR